MTTYVLRDGELIEKDLVPPLHVIHERACHYISDIMDPTRHMATGRMFDSKKRFRAETRAAGCVEVGDQKDYGKRRAPPKLDKRERVEHIKRSIYELQNGRSR
jgi:hypothetical protein